MLAQEIINGLRDNKEQGPTLTGTLWRDMKPSKKWVFEILFFSFTFIQLRTNHEKEDYKLLSLIKIV